MHLDADRDGRVDDDRTGLDRWEWGAGKKGAIILCNNDDDDGGASGKSDNTDRQVNGGNDSSEIAPLVIRRTGCSPPTGWRATLEVSMEDKMRIRIFDGRSAGAQEIIGPTQGNRYAFPDLNFMEKELGMEALMYADNTFSGEVRITFTLSKAGVASTPEVGVVRVAPWMMPNHLDAAVKVFVVDKPEIAVPLELSPTRTSDNSRFRIQLNTFVTAAHCTLRTHRSDDPWMQDCMEIGFSNLPAGPGYPSAMRSARNRPLQTFAKTLRTADFGYHEKGVLLKHTTFNSTGNLECTPPVTSAAGKRYPWGRIYFGPGRPREPMDVQVQGFLRRQIVQDPITVDTSFMAIGHVDEIMSFVPAPGGQGFKLLLASPRLAYDILEANKTANGSSKMLTGRKLKDVINNRWRYAEVTIETFLDTGIETMSLTASELKTLNDGIQNKMNANREKLTSDLGLTDADILEVPILFHPSDVYGLPKLYVDSLTAGVVNMLVINGHCVIPKPFGPVVAGKDLFEKDLEDKLTPLGLTVHFIDDWYEYHVDSGEVHCGTNTLRARMAANWWEFTP